MIQLTFKVTGTPVWIDPKAVAAVYVSSADPTITVVERHGSPTLYLVSESVEDVLHLARPLWRLWR
jgi:hypothetical protein